MQPRIQQLIVLMAALCTVAAGCCSAPPKLTTAAPPGIESVAMDVNLEPLQAMLPLEAMIDPPIGWRRDKFDVDAKHAHVTWISPSGDTAYGVVLMRLPLPVGPDMVLWGFMNHLQASDKRADLLNEQRAPDLPGLRFVAESGQYRIRVNLIVRDWRAWAVYAGNLLGKPENATERALAEKARDRTRVGITTKTTALR